MLKRFLVRGVLAIGMPAKTLQRTVFIFLHLDHPPGWQSGFGYPKKWEYP